VLGGGNVKKLKELPQGCRVGDNTNAFLGGFRLWEEDGAGQSSRRTRTHDTKKRKKGELKVVTTSKRVALAKAG
jgi:hypothetical protein